MTKPAKKPVNIRVDEEVITAFDKWATENGWSRTQALEGFMRSSVGMGTGPKKKANAAKPKPSNEKCMHPISRRIDGQCAICFEKVGGK